MCELYILVAYCAVFWQDTMAKMWHSGISFFHETLARIRNSYRNAVAQGRQAPLSCHAPGSCGLLPPTSLIIRICN